MKTKIFIHKKLPFVELRYVDRVTSCDKKHLHDQLTLTAIREGAMNIVYNDHIDVLLPNTLSVVNPHVVKKMIIVLR